MTFHVGIAATSWQPCCTMYSPVHESQTAHPCARSWRTLKARATRRQGQRWPCCSRRQQSLQQPRQLRRSLGPSLKTSRSRRIWTGGTCVVHGASVRRGPTCTLCALLAVRAKSERGPLHAHAGYRSNWRSLGTRSLAWTATRRSCSVTAQHYGWPKRHRSSRESQLNWDCLCDSASAPLYSMRCCCCWPWHACRAPSRRRPGGLPLIAGSAL